MVSTNERRGRRGLEEGSRMRSGSKSQPETKAMGRHGQNLASKFRVRVHAYLRVGLVVVATKKCGTTTIMFVP